MRWEAVVAVYQSNVGAVYVDLNPASNSIGVNEDLTTKGVVRRDQSTPNGFRKAYFDSDDEKMIAFYSKVLMFAPERLTEYRSGDVPFPSVRLNSDTIIDLFPKKIWQKSAQANQYPVRGFVTGSRKAVPFNKSLQ